MELTQPSEMPDLRGVVGYPRTPVPKVSPAVRASLKKALETDSTIDPVLGIRISVAAGVSLRPEWLNRGLLDLALSSTDLAKHIDKLITSDRMGHKRVGVLLNSALCSTSCRSETRVVSLLSLG
jgi:hypothetical protein